MYLHVADGVLIQLYGAGIVHADPRPCNARRAQATQGERTHVAGTVNRTASHAATAHKVLYVGIDRSDMCSNTTLRYQRSDWAICSRPRNML